MKNTGALLKSKRESSNLSLSEVALATKINPKILAAIENGDERNLPAKTFLKGFIRSYALFLKMDVDSVMRTFMEEMGGPPPAPPTAATEVSKPLPKAGKAEPSASTARRRVGDESSSGMRTIAVVVIVVLIGLIIGVRELIEKYQRERVVDTSADLAKATPVSPVTEQAKGDVSAAAPAEPAPPAASAETATAPAATTATDVAPDTGDVVTIDSATVPPAPKTVDTSKPAEVKPIELKGGDVKAVDVKVTAEPAATPSKVTAQAQPVVPTRDMIRKPVSNLVELRPTELSPPKPIEVKEEPKAAEAKPAAAAAPVPAPAAETKPEEAKPEAAAVKSAKNEIILEALDKVEVKFQVKGETKRVSLGPTQVHTIHAELPMTLDLSDGGAVNIILNGRERGVPGDLGKPKTIKIP